MARRQMKVIADAYLVGDALLGEAADVVELCRLVDRSLRHRLRSEQQHDRFLRLVERVGPCDGNRITQLQRLSVDRETPDRPSAGYRGGADCRGRREKKDEEERADGNDA